MSEMKPIWVWCYLRAVETSESGLGDMPPLSVWPQAHTYAFESEEEALAHPEAVKWGKVHGYTLQRVWLQTKPTPITEGEK